MTVMLSVRVRARDTSWRNQTGSSFSRSNRRREFQGWGHTRRRFRIIHQLKLFFLQRNL